MNHIESVGLMSKTLHETLDFFVEWETLLTPFHSVSNNLDQDEEIILAHAVAESARVTAEHAKSDDTSKCALPPFDANWPSLETSDFLIAFNFAHPGARSSGG